MTFVDRQGRLFGRFNIVNVLVLVIIVAAGTAGAYKLLVAEQEGLVETKTILLTLEVADVRQPSVDAVAIGERVFGYATEIPLGEVIESRAEPHREPVATAAGQILMAEVPGRFDLFMVVQAEGVVGPNAITVSGCEVKIGVELPISGRLFSFRATIIGIEEVDG